MVSTSKKHKMKFSISKFVVNKNNFCRKFLGLSAAKDFVAKFNSAIISMSTTDDPNIIVTLGAEIAVMSEGEEMEANTGFNSLKTPSKKKKGSRKRSATQKPEGAELVSPEKTPKADLVDEEIEAHYLGMLFIYHTTLL